MGSRRSFPAAPKPFSQELQSLDFRLGLWCGAFWMSAGLSAEVDRLHDAFLLWQGKPLTIPHRDLGPMYVLDPTHPETQAFLRDVFTTYRRWGVRYYMIDFLDAITGASPGRHLNDGYYDRSVIPVHRRGAKDCAPSARPPATIRTCSPAPVRKFS